MDNYFPNARIVHIYRNGIDVALSLKNRNLNLSGPGHVDTLNEFTPCFRLWEKYVGQALKIRDKSDIRQIHIAYEKILDRDELTIGAAEEFLGIKNLAAKVDKIVFERRNTENLNTLSSEEKEIVSSSELMKTLGYSGRNGLL